MFCVRARALSQMLRSECVMSCREDSECKHQATTVDAVLAMIHLNTSLVTKQGHEGRRWEHQKF